MILMIHIKSPWHNLPSNILRSQTFLSGIPTYNLIWNIYPRSQQGIHQLVLVPSFRHSSQNPNDILHPRIERRRMKVHLICRGSPVIIWSIQKLFSKDSHIANISLILTSRLSKTKMNHIFKEWTPTPPMKNHQLRGKSWLMISTKLSLQGKGSAQDWMRSKSLRGRRGWWRTNPSLNSNWILTRIWWRIISKGMTRMVFSNIRMIAGKHLRPNLLSKTKAGMMSTLIWNASVLK